MSKPFADNARVSFSTQGIPQVASGFSKFEVHSTPKYAVGFKIEDYNGNIYRYAHFSANVNRGVLLSPELATTGLDDTDNVVTPTASVVNSGDNALGSKYVELNVSAIASVLANDYQGGRLVITDDTGEGYTYDILGNTAKGNPSGSLARITLRDPLQASLDATTDLSVQSNRWSNLKIATATDTDVVGVSCVTMAVATSMYGWIQTKGVVGILQDGAIPVGAPVQLSDGVSGAVQMMGGSTVSAVAAGDLITEPIIGWCVMSGDTTGAGTFRIDVD